MTLRAELAAVRLFATGIVNWYPALKGKQWDGYCDYLLDSQDETEHGHAESVGWLLAAMAEDSVAYDEAWSAPPRDPTWSRIDFDPFAVIIPGDFNGPHGDIADAVRSQTNVERTRAELDRAPDARLDDTLDMEPAEVTGGEGGGA